MGLTMNDQDADSYQIDGEHYRKNAISPWMIIESYDLDFFEGSALAYLLRRKPGISRATDLRKCAHYLHKCIERAERT